MTSLTLYNGITTIDYCGGVREYSSELPTDILLRWAQFQDMEFKRFRGSEQLGVCDTGVLATNFEFIIVKQVRTATGTRVDTGAKKLLGGRPITLRGRLEGCPCPFAL